LKKSQPEYLATELVSAFYLSALYFNLNTVCCMEMAQQTSEPLPGDSSPTHQQQQRNCWKRCVLCGLTSGYILRASEATELDDHVEEG
jgi:hypothetical protein